MTPDFLGIARERLYSPGKVDADRAILDAVADRLAAAHRVRVVSADQPLPAVVAPTLVFAMCQGPDALATLRGWEAAGVRVVNSSAAIANTHRRRMLAAFERRAIAHPPSRLVSTAAGTELPEWTDAAGAWIKRGDVHATEPDDVVRVDGTGAARDALAALGRRGIATALVQRHVAGDVFKFYAVRGRFFTAFAAADTCPLTADETAAMRALAEAGAAALALEVFGGDCVRDGAGDLWLVDVNDWPSYARCRDAASAAIAAYLAAQAAPG